MAWEVHLVRALPLPPLVAGALLALGLGLCSLLYAAVFGFPVLSDVEGEAFTRSASSSLLLSAVVGYAVGAMAYGQTAARAVVSEDRSLADLRQEGLRLRRGSRWAGAAGVLFAFVVLEAMLLIEGVNPLGSWYSPHEFLLTLYVALLLGWVGGRVGYHTVFGTRERADAAEASSIDLLDLDRFHVHGRLGLRFALLWLVGAAILAPAVFQSNDSLGPTLLAIPFVLGMAVMAMLLPAVGIRRRIAAAKRAELAAVDRAIRGDPAALAGMRATWPHRELGLADLIAYRSLVDSQPEWPFDTTTLRRFGLYLLIPIGSWVAAAMVERFLDRWLG